MDVQMTETPEQSTLTPAANAGTTETLEDSTMPPLTNEETPEASDQPSLPPVTNTQTAETSENSTPLPVTNTQTAETSEHLAPLPTEISELAVTNILTTETSELPVANILTTETSEHSTILSVTNTQTSEASEHSTLPSEVNDGRRDNSDNLAPALENNGGMGFRSETSDEEVESILKVIAATGKFWHNWEKLRSMLSIHLKQVLSEYPEAKMTTEEQSSLLGETYVELVKRLDDALHSFVEAPPFTLQRLCEIILEARSLYPNLSKLALALEKNLSVTSTLLISTCPYPSAMVTKPNGHDKVTEDSNPLLQSDPVLENGAPPGVADRDEIMSEVEADVGDDMAMDMETFEDIVRSTESSSMTTGNQ